MNARRRVFISTAFVGIFHRNANVTLSANALYGQEDRVGYYSECGPGGANSDGQYSEAGPGRASGTYYDALDTPDYAMSNAEDPAYGAMQNPGEYNMVFL